MVIVADSPWSPLIPLKFRLCGSHEIAVLCYHMTMRENERTETSIARALNLVSKSVIAFLFIMDARTNSTRKIGIIHASYLQSVAREMKNEHFNRSISWTGK